MAFVVPEYPDEYKSILESQYYCLEGGNYVKKYPKNIDNIEKVKVNYRNYAEEIFLQMGYFKEKLVDGGDKNMLLKDLKQNMFLPKQEISINKIVNIRGIDVQLISITEEEHRNVLWVMYKLPENNFEDLDRLEERMENNTNRDEKINSIKDQMSSHIGGYISEIIIQDQKMTFSSSSSNSIYNRYDTNYESYMRMQHFIEKGMITAKWDEVELKNIIIVAYKQEEREKFPEIDFAKALDITIKISELFKEVLICKPISIDVGELEKGKEFYFYDSLKKKDRIFYYEKSFCTR